MIISYEYFVTKDPEGNIIKKQHFSQKISKFLLLMVQLNYNEKLWINDSDEIWANMLIIQNITR